MTIVIYFLSDFINYIYILDYIPLATAVYNDVDDMQSGELITTKISQENEKGSAFTVYTKNYY